MKISLDSPIMSRMEQVADILTAGFFWLVCSIPVITIGPSTIALYYTIVKVVRRNRDTVTKAFFHSFKENLRQGIAVTVIYLAYGSFILFYIANVLYGKVQLNPYYCCIIGIMSGAPFLFTALYIFPVISRFQAGFIKQLQYAWYMSVRHFFSTILLAAMLGAVCTVIYFLPFSMVILPGLYMYAASFIIERILRKYQAERNYYG